MNHSNLIAAVQLSVPRSAELVQSADGDAEMSVWSSADRLSDMDADHLTQLWFNGFLLGSYIDCLFVGIRLLLVRNALELLIKRNIPQTCDYDSFYSYLEMKRRPSTTRMTHSLNHWPTDDGQSQPSLSNDRRLHRLHEEKEKRCVIECRRCIRIFKNLEIVKSEQ